MNPSLVEHVNSLLKTPNIIVDDLSIEFYDLEFETQEFNKASISYTIE